MSQEPLTIENLFNCLINSEPILFPMKGKADIERKHGVYIIYNSEGHVCHVGNTVRAKDGLYKRLSDHLYTKSSFTKAFLGKKNGKLLRNVYTFKYLFINCSRKRMLVQSLAVGRLCPIHLGTHQIKP